MLSTACSSFARDCVRQHHRLREYVPGHPDAKAILGASTDGIGMGAPKNPLFPLPGSLWGSCSVDKVEFPRGAGSRYAETSPDFHRVGPRKFAATSATIAGCQWGQGRVSACHYHLLREYMMDHAEVRAILGATD